MASPLPLVEFRLLDSETHLVDGLLADIFRLLWQERDEIERFGERAQIIINVVGTRPTADITRKSIQLKQA